MRLPVFDQLLVLLLRVRRRLKSRPRHRAAQVLDLWRLPLQRMCLIDGNCESSERTNTEIWESVSMNTHQCECEVARLRCAAAVMTSNRLEIHLLQLLRVVQSAPAQAEAEQSLLQWAIQARAEAALGAANRVNAQQQRCSGSSSQRCRQRISICNCVREFEEAPRVCAMLSAWLLLET